MQMRANFHNVCLQIEMLEMMQRSIRFLLTEYKNTTIIKKIGLKHYYNLQKDICHREGNE